MVVLPPGSFRASDYRKPIPAAVSRQVRKRYEEDHRPPLQDRPYDTEAGDFIPSQHDPDTIFLIERQAHLRLTVGRAEGAERTATTLGSDVHTRSKSRRIGREPQRWTRAMLAPKSVEAKEKPSRWPKRKLRSRSNLRKGG
jgi:hypothetical protein